MSGTIVPDWYQSSVAGPSTGRHQSDRYFDSDSVALRCTWRAGHAVVRPDRIGSFAVTTAGSWTVLELRPRRVGGVSVCAGGDG